MLVPILTDLSPVEPVIGAMVWQPHDEAPPTELQALHDRAIARIRREVNLADYL